MAPPRREFDLDVIALINVLRHRDNRNVQADILVGQENTVAEAVRAIGVAEPTSL